MAFRDIFFQLLLLLVGIIIGIIAPLLPIPQQKRLGLVFSFLLVAIGLIWLGIEIRIRQAASTPPAAITATTLIETSTFIATSMPTDTSVPPVMVSIMSPFDGADVPRIITVSGKYQSIPEDRQIWLYVYGTFIKKYFLQQIDSFNDGSWQARDVIIGDPDEKGTRYKIGVISVDQPDNERLQTISFPLDQLPRSAESLIEITVYRE
jgi:hypothetical protein